MGLKLLAEIGLDGSGFERGLHKIGRDAAASVKNLAVQAFGIYGVEQAIAKTVETASDLVDASQRLDVTVEQLQLLRQAAKDAGSDMGALTGAFEKLDIARAKALGGDKDAIAAFAKLGVNQAQLQSQTASTLFTGSISNTVKNSNAEDIGPVLKEVFGKSFGELIPVLKTDFDELGGKMKALGTIMDTDTAVKLDALGDNFSLLSSIIAVQLGPVLVQVSILFLEMVGKIKAFGAFLGALSEKGLLKGGAALAQAMLDTPVGKIIDTVGLGKAIADTLAPGTEGEDLMTKGAAAFDETDKEYKKLMDAIQDRLDKAAEELKHPKPRKVDVPGPDAPAAKHMASAQSDSLVRVGNFLGSNGNTIERVNKQKIQLLTRIADSNDKLVMKMQGGGFGSFGLGVPLN